MSSNSISLRLNAEDIKLFKDYANLKGINLSEMIRQAVLDRIEDEIDLEAYSKAKAEFDKDPTTYNMEEAKRLLGL